MDKSPFGLLITTEVNGITYEIALDGKYPLQAPRVSARSEFEFPSPADGRDYLFAAMYDWTPRVSVAALLQRLQQYEFDPTHCQFSLGRPFKLNAWDKPGMRAFPATEIDPLRPSFSQDRILVVTHSMLLQLQVYKPVPGYAHLVAACSFSALAALKKSEDNPEHIILDWKQFAQHFKVALAEDFINLVVENVKKLGGAVRTQVKKRLAAIGEDEVTQKSLMKINIRQIVKQIPQLESTLHEKLDYTRIQRLIKLYQGAVEYYSALNNPKYEGYLARMQDLMKDERVLSVYLAGQTEAPSSPSSEVRDRLEDELLNEASPTTAPN